MKINFIPLDSYLDSLLDFGFPMFDCTVHRNCEELYSRRGGYIDAEKKLRHQPHTLYYLYSVSKVVTCAAALTLLDDGAFTLDDPIAQYMPEFAAMKVRHSLSDGTVSLTDALRDITVEHLFTMSAGFDYNLNSESIKAAREKYPAAPTREIIRALAQEPLCFEPGERWQYSLCHDLLAALCEVVSGRRFADYVRDRIFMPLGMEHSSYHISEAEKSEMAQQYIYNDAEKRADIFGKTNGYILGDDYDSGGAGMISTAGDCIRFADALACGGVGANGARILRPETVELMRANRLSPAQLGDYCWDQLRGYGYGLGVRTMTDRETGPYGEFGWGGAAGALTYIDPDRGIAVYYAQHTLNPHEEKVLPELRDVIFGCLSDI
ncbi:MAG: serine hydrolase [Eubacteriales bacterium]|nr:serine hydrolase [Eubacteriales bacterium]